MRMSDRHQTEHAENTVGQNASSSLLGTSRRKFMVAGSASWASISLAGCSDLLGNGEEENGEEEVPHFVVTDEVIAGSEGIPEGASGFVTPGRPQRAFVPGMQAVFKIGVWDPETGDIVSDEALEEATVELDRDVTVNLEFLRGDREWSGDWMIPEDEEPGTVGYSIEVSNGAEFTGVGIATSELEVIEFEGPAANYVVTISTYSTETRAGGYVQSCLPQHNYTPGMKVGFDVAIYDGASGELVGPDAVDEAIIEFETDDSITLEWSEEDGLWNETWMIPEDREPGTLTYEVLVSADRDVHVAGHRSHHSVAQDSIEVIEDPEESK